MNALRIAVIGAVLVGLGGAAFVTVRMLAHDPPYDDARAVASVLAQTQAEAPLAGDVELPIANHAEAIRRPHARVELGRTELRIFGTRVSAMPSFDASALSSSELTSIASWGAAGVHDAGAELRTLELAVDREVRFGLVAQALTELVRADVSPSLFLVKRTSGELGVFHPSFTILGEKVVRVDAAGASLEGAPPCTWKRGEPTVEFERCLRGHDVVEAGAPSDAGAPSSLVELALSSRHRGFTIAPNADVRWVDVIAVVDAVVGAGFDFNLALATKSPDPL